MIASRIHMPSEPDYDYTALRPIGDILPAVLARYGIASENEPTTEPQDCLAVVHFQEETDYAATPALVTQ